VTFGGRRQRFGIVKLRVERLKLRPLTPDEADGSRLSGSSCKPGSSTNPPGR
jgi:hypothetical protein